MATTSPWRHAIVVGASSGIGAAVARRPRRGRHPRGARRAATGRSSRRSARAIADADRRPRTGARVPHDVTRGAGCRRLVQRICHALGGLDLLVYAAGIMPRIGADEYDLEKDRAIIDGRTSSARWRGSTPSPSASRAAARGTIVGISSVAGDRGRRGNPAYHASKAALDALPRGGAEPRRAPRRARRHRQAGPGRHADDAGHGQAAAPRLAGRRGAPSILARRRAQRHTVYVPAKWRPIMFVIRHIPSLRLPAPRHLSMLPADRLERVCSWGGATSAMSWVYRPTTVDGLREVLALAPRRGPQRRPSRRRAELRRRARPTRRTSASTRRA